MYNLVFAGGIDLTEVILVAFVAFLFAIAFYIRREDRREGYPLEDDVTGKLESVGGFVFNGKPKAFRLGHGSIIYKPDSVRDGAPLNAARTSGAPGSPLTPVGDPMLAGVGPGSYANRAKTVDMMVHGTPKIVPLRDDPSFTIPAGGPDPRGMKVVGADGAVAGIVTDAWVDRAESLIRYLEVAVEAPAAGLSVVGAAPASKTVLLPMTMADVKRGKKTVRVAAITAAQFANVPTTESEHQLTLYEEERIVAYYGAGFLYATPNRLEPLL